MSISQRALAIGLALSTCPAPLLAQEAAQPDTSFSVGTIVVTARGMAGNTGTILTSVDRMGGATAQAANTEHTWELVGQLPGVQVTDFNQGTTSGKFSFRAFNGEGTINGVKLLIDGVPSNSNDGNMPYIDLVFPLGIAGIEVVRGTADPRFGLHAIAGSAAITTRSGGTYADARTSVGSNAALSAHLAAGVETGVFTQDYVIGWRQADGYRDHGHSNRVSLSGKWGLALGPDLRLTALARHYEGDAEEAGYLTLADRTADPRITNGYNQSDGDSRTMDQFAAKADASLGDRLDWSFTAWANVLRDDRYVKFSANASQQRRLTQEDHQGLATALHWHGMLGAMPLMLEAGGSVEWQDNRSLRWLAVNRVATSQTRDQQYDLTVGGAYVQAVLEPADWLRITPAWRVDWVGGSFHNRLAGSSAPINHYGSIDQPKLSVAVLPAAGVTLYGNWGKSFQIGLGSGAYLIAPRVVDLAPSINEGWEAGVKYQLSSRMEARIAWWQQTATGEIARKLNDPLGDFENVGATRRKGLDLQASWQPLGGLSLWGALAWQQALIATPDPATPHYAGNHIDHVPEWLWSGGIDYAPTPVLNLSLATRGQSAYHLTSANAQGTWGQMAVVDMNIRYQLHPGLELGLAVQNLLDEFHEYVWWDGAQSLHSPADGRTWTASLRARF
ncbi:MAG: TonB-dependent receptor [Croceibacterium sp.]